VLQFNLSDHPHKRKLQTTGISAIAPAVAGKKMKWFAGFACVIYWCRKNTEFEAD
jgi:hypothetical protein